MVLRSLEYYRLQVAPVLSGTLPPSFWTRLIPQMIYHEPVIRNAATAVGSLYEDYQNGLTRNLKSSNRDFALTQYNKAIHHVAHSQTGNLDIMITLCILFMSIEFLRGNSNAALFHYRHGRKILNSYNAPPHLLGVFRQLNVFTLFYSDFLDSPLSNGTINPSPNGPFDDLTQAQESLDWLTYRSMNVSFALNQCIMMTEDNETINLLLSQVRQLDRDLDVWSQAFTLVKGDHDPRPIHGPICQVLEARWLICKMWISQSPGDRSVPSPSHDYQGLEFQRITDLAFGVARFEAKDSVGVIIGAGFPAVLHFLIIRSRSLELRLAALSLFKEKCCLEIYATWDSKLLYTAAKTALEEEHGILLGSEWVVGDEWDFERLLRAKTLRRQAMFKRAHFLCPWAVVMIDACEKTEQLKL
ncbi:C6 zinc finger domain-containing protein [Penicillium malachiteum]|uniref:C6 zinc finger domain-containing protein n=1 Tax=Penicillium malachiteum TaxID=1324776 RepID=UPI00254975C9|nr:C6 zinc finger domain-containing protein [Penicillium malachiteum]KAJ5734881.1 C6 zinc finger domain-containing protein [Penicillium malachiteum]